MISAAVEGIVDEAVVRKLATYVGGECSAVYGKAGKPALRDRIQAFNNAARFAPWLVVVDLDHEAACAAELRDTWLPEPAELLCFRVAVRQVEAWLIADSETLARYLHVPRSRVPADPESLPNSKEAMVNIARHSRRKAVREDMVPKPGSGRVVGPAYTSRLIEYVDVAWRPASASKKSDSLRRAVSCIRRLAGFVR